MGFFVQPVFVAQKIAVIYSNIKLHCIASLGSKTLAPVLGTVSLTTLTAISIDRLLALVFSVSYRTVVTIRVIAKILVLLWLLEITLSILLFIDPLSLLYCVIFLLVLCFTVNTLAYVKLPCLIHQHHTILSMNSLVNPAFYCWKIRRIRDAITEMLPSRFQE